MLTYVLHSLSVCYFRLNVCFLASRVYLRRHLAMYSFMNLFLYDTLLLYDICLIFHITE